MEKINDLINLSLLEQNVTQRNEFKMVRMINFIKEVKQNPPDTYLDFLTLKVNLYNAVICLFISIILLILTPLSYKRIRIIPSIFLMSLVYLSLVPVYAFEMPSELVDLCKVVTVILGGFTIITFIFLNTKLNCFGYLGCLIGNNIFQIIYSFVDSDIILLLPIISISLYFLITLQNKFYKIISLVILLNQLFLVCILSFIIT
ncbi:hypothetical protein EHI_036610 [Entamoeba histolytica HM-1:IMSS]|uniref:Uncharacterized protein n=2 Tax=Entamoeba histolytica (strain ATCC 30459 / HM-1:IMSS / ABRM) TaxID=294381 RepID=B1N498_ENTH1|nr:hypothetical protein EHI_036610 [Entamoeba histolytica HM-1:IMSS]EDS89212.1 hypothetical protein EHI_036610 [Entamoeba histolytica HM-1:IMSS]ENY60853.1 hypothetical protein EHI7A_028740 [Entamoeba histolytica HM-1:IMSS-A]|eukprot:XP_001914014.1 hypothetical protein EHI_036610 [Entamoeba histolytica HM-1:IMSS]